MPWSNLLFGLNQDVMLGTTDASSTATGYDVDNLITGSRNWHWKSATGSTSGTYIRYARSGTALNYCAVCRADYHLRHTETSTHQFEIYHSTDDVSYTKHYDSGNLTSADLVGPNSQDWIWFDNSGAVSKAYWRLYFIHGSPQVVECAKVFMGEAFDIGRDPVTVDFTRTRPTGSLRKSRYEINLEYEDISYTNAMLFMTYVVKRSNYHTFVIFTADDDDILLGMGMIHVRLLTVDMPQVIRARNNISMTLQEVI